MSNSTRQGGYDERLVVPLEASRRGAHRARVGPLVAALPLLAVAIVVAGVIGVAYALFIKPSNTADTGSQTLPTTSSAPPTTSAPAGAPSSTGSGAGASTSPSPSSSASPGAVDKAVSIRIYNGSSAPRVTGLAARTATVLKGAGWSGATVRTSAAPGGNDPTTRIYYATSRQRATAQAIKQSLGGAGVIRQNSAIAGQGIAVVVGNDVHA